MLLPRPRAINTEPTISPAAVGQDKSNPKNASCKNLDSCPAKSKHAMPTLVRPVAVPAKSVPLFSADFLSVTVFCGIGLLISLVAIVAGEQGVWF
jgi:hypothetical protein